MRFEYDDGGRKAAGYTGDAGDCTVRSIAIATGKPYQEVYDGLFAFSRREKLLRRRGKSPRDGVFKGTIKRYMQSIGWRFIPTMGIGTGCKVHLKDGELPNGRLVVAVSRHNVAVIDGVIHDTYDPSRDGTRCVYGYWVGPDHGKPKTVKPSIQAKPAVASMTQQEGGEAKVVATLAKARAARGQERTEGSAEGSGVDGASTHRNEQRAGFPAYQSRQHDIALALANSQ